MKALRLLGRFFLLLAFAEVAIGIWIWLAGHDVTRSAGEVWYALEPGSLNLSQAIVQRYLPAGNLGTGGGPAVAAPVLGIRVLLFILFLVMGSGIVYFTVYLLGASPPNPHNERP